MALTFLVLNDIMSNKDRERRRILLMNDTRLKKFFNFEPKYLRYYKRSNEPYYDPRNFVVRKANFFPNLGQHLTVLLHLWDMRALYHYIECYSFAYVYSGEFIMHVDDTETVIKEGEMCIVPPGVLQKNTENYRKKFDSPPIMVKFLVPPEDIHNALNSVFFVSSPVNEYLTDTMSKSNYNHFFIMRNQTEYGKNIAELAIMEILRSLDTKTQNSNAASSLLSSLIFSYVDSENFEYEFSKTKYENADTTSVIIEYIRKDLKNITLNELCEKFHYTPSYICRMIKSRTGMTFKELLNSERLVLASRELLRTDAPVKEIAQSSGYPSIEYFYRCFKKKYGVTPSEYRTIIGTDDQSSE